MSAPYVAGPVDNRQSQESKLFAVPYTAVSITDGFLANYQQVNRTVSLVHGFNMLEKAGNFANLRIATGLAEGKFAGYWFADSDVYKWLEAVGWELGRAADAELQAMADKAITLVEQAQQEDGYLDSYYQFALPGKRWTDLDHGHELYCAGHLIQAAVAWQRAVGDERLLNVTLRLVDHIYDLFGPGKREETCGHPEIEMALVELYRLTQDARHLELAQLFIDRRGMNKMRGHAGYGAVYQQDHLPVREAQEVVGHAVRQLYLTTGATDLYMETAENALLQAMHTLWDDMTQHKLYVTGGLGSRFDGESFGGPYELPSETGYCETCAAIASLMWNWRLLLITGERQYADLFEHTLYNGVLSSPGLEGASYLYVNPLQVQNGRYVRASVDTGTGEDRLRPAWHNCACCPPNVMRTLSSLSHYLATVNAVGVQIHQFANANLDLTVHDQSAKLTIATNYPWDGTIVVTVQESPAEPWQLSLRLPRWCQQYAVTLNGSASTSTLGENGYLLLERSWQPGDVLRLELHMEPLFLAPHPRIDAVRGCAALQRGPLLYCFESQDQPDGVELQDVQVVTKAALVDTAVPPFTNMQLIQVPGQMNRAAWGDALYRPLADLPPTETTTVTLTAIPYFAWGNRGMKSMRVWLPLTNGDQ
ncbi:MAG: glycoside hydrolase family 127 protein [Ardenticatenaceae bacterium]|nr:glycoside hydrolase family 127 protein [Ardenticatenaceae bacterium]